MSQIPRLRVMHVRAALRSGRKAAIPFWSLDSGKAGPCFLVLAAQHGNEVQGSEAIRRFVDLAARGMAGGSMERPALQRLLRDVKDGKIDVVVVYKVDRLSRSVLDLSRLVEIFDRHRVSFVSVT